MNKKNVQFISALMIFLPISAFAQEYIYPNKLPANRGLIEYRPYTLEEARAIEGNTDTPTNPWVIADWGPERRLTVQEDVYSANLRNAGDTLLCAYETIWGRQTFFIKSTDNGDNWQSYIALGDSESIRRHFFPELARNGSNLILGSSIWHYDEMGYNLAYFGSTDLGDTWGSIRTVFRYYRAFQSNFASLTNSGSTLFFAYNEGDHDSLYVIRSTNWGNSWEGRGINVAYLSATIQNMCLRASGDYLHLVWVNEVGTINVRYSRSTDRGQTWSPEIDIAEDPQGAQWCHVAVQDSHVAVSWMGYRYSPYMFTGDYFIRHSFDNGATWDSAHFLTEAHLTRATNVSISDSVVAACWVDARFEPSGNDEIIARVSMDRGQSWLEEQRLSFGSSLSYPPGSAEGGNRVHVLWGDNRPEGRGLYYCQNDLLTSINNENINTLPEKVSISAYPNPFNSSVIIDYFILEEKRGVISIYNIRGQLLTAFNIHGKEGSIFWNAKDKNNNPLASGIYFAKISASVGCSTMKLTYLK